MTYGAIALLFRLAEVGTMSVIVESRIIGTFLGYAPGIVHRLDDASEWEQVGDTRE